MFSDLKTLSLFPGVRARRYSDGGLWWCSDGGNCRGWGRGMGWVWGLVVGLRVVGLGHGYRILDLGHGYLVLAHWACCKVLVQCDEFFSLRAKREN